MITQANDVPASGDWDELMVFALFALKELKLLLMEFAPTVAIMSSYQMEGVFARVDSPITLLRSASLATNCLMDSSSTASARFAPAIWS